MLAALPALLLLDHYRIHGYWFDAHDLLLRTDSGLGFDSHEFFVMLSALLAALLAVSRMARGRERVSSGTEDRSR
ncbi:hypothetical protein AMJ57_02275 [Parcubacteria bacterium SG8_24]|nr:MAG: hypothetical protein AMJ57_02275 [Parcubacteria bacterium SG8_24]